MRDQIQAIENVVERQKVISSDYIDSDVIAMARSNGEACVQVFFIRSGKLIGREYFLLEGTEDDTGCRRDRRFHQAILRPGPHVPTQVLLPNEVEEAQIIQQWLNQKRGGEKVEIMVPHAGTAAGTDPDGSRECRGNPGALKAQWQADTHHQEPGAGRAAGSARHLPSSAQPHRVLRHLQHPGHGRGWQHGGLRAGRSQQEATTAASTSAA